MFSGAGYVSETLLRGNITKDSSLGNLNDEKAPQDVRELLTCHGRGAVLVSSRQDGVV